MSKRNPLKTYRAIVTVTTPGGRRSENFFGPFIKKSDANQAMREEIAHIRELGKREKGWRATGRLQGFKAGISDESLASFWGKKNMATKKKKKRKPVAKKRSVKKNRATKKKASKRSNPGKALKSKIAQMKPNTWYPTTLSGAKVKVKRAGSKLIIMPAKRK